MPYDILVYDCVDLDWAYSSVALRRSALKRWHSILLQRADIILFSMRALFEEVKEKRPGCYFVPNACSSAHFNGSAPCPPVLQPIPNPRIGFIGAMLGQRFDAALIRAAAKARPQWSFVLVGDADEPTRAALRGITNIYFLGRFPHADMPAFAVHFDVCLIPNLLQTELSYCFPKKLYEYLATGRPVVSTPIPEVTPLAPLVKISRTPGEFVQKIEQCLTENLDPARAAKLGAERQAIASENTWERRVAQIVGILDSELRSRGYSGLEGTARVTP
jgi:glycosyltransferase involved in cell wall biosynthesis